MASTNDEKGLLKWREFSLNYSRRFHLRRGHEDDVAQEITLRLPEGKARGEGIPECPSSEAKYRRIVTPIVRALRPRRNPREWEEAARAVIHPRRHDEPPGENRLFERLKGEFSSSQLDSLLRLFSGIEKPGTPGKIAKALGVSPRTWARRKQRLRAEFGASPRDDPPR